MLLNALELSFPNKVLANLQTREAELEVHNQRKLQDLLVMKDRDLKVQRRKNPRSENEPFSIHYAAANGELER